jgi:hypothetical protein
MGNGRGHLHQPESSEHDAGSSGFARSCTLTAPARITKLRVLATIADALGGGAMKGTVRVVIVAAVLALVAAVSVAIARPPLGQLVRDFRWWILTVIVAAAVLLLGRLLFSILLLPSDPQPGEHTLMRKPPLSGTSFARSATPRPWSPSTRV